jgi:hypothetical protein
MTEDEKRQQKAMLLLEYQEAESNLAHLREKAGRMSAPIEQIGKWVSHAQSAETHPAYNRYSQEYRSHDAAIRTNLDLYRKSLDFDAVLALMDEIKAAEEALHKLGRRKAELGLK